MRADELISFLKYFPEFVLALNLQKMNPINHDTGIVKLCWEQSVFQEEVSVNSINDSTVILYRSTPVCSLPL